MMTKKGNTVAPTATATMPRLMIYQPSQRPRQRAGDWFDAPGRYGRARVTGRLGQRHADLLEAVLYHAEAARDVPGGGVDLLVDPARVRRSMSDSGYSLQRIDALFADLRAAVIEIESPALDSKIVGGLIDHKIPSSATRPDPLTGGERNLWVVRVGAALVMLINRDIRLYYDPAPLARLEHGVSQAVARHVLSHQREPAGGWKIDTLIKAVCGDVSGQARWDARRRIKADADGLAAAGVLIDGDRVRTAKTLAHRPGDPVPDPARPEGDPGTPAR